MHLHGIYLHYEKDFAHTFELGDIVVEKRPALEEKELEKLFLSQKEETKAQTYRTLTKGLCPKFNGNYARLRHFSTLGEVQKTTGYKY